MHIYYLYNLLLFSIFPILGRRIIYFIAFTYPLFLLYLPETGYDFSYYQRAYNTVYFDPNAPLFFRSASELTAEPGWFTYTGLVHYLVSDYRWFLVFNFLLSLVLVVKSFAVLEIDRDKVGLMIATMVPISFITIMFWSPRSAMPLALCFLGIAYFEKRRELLGLLCFLLASMIHSQYVVVILSVCLFYFFRRYLLAKFNISAIILMAIAVLVLGYFAIDYILVIISFLPTSAIISSKLHYLDAASSGFRTSGLLSIVIYPLFMIFFRKNPEFRKLETVLVVLTAFSLLINIAFVSNAHIAGRLSRVSDYFLFSYVLATTAFLVSPRIGSLVLIPLFIGLPFLFPDLYDFQEVLENLGFL